jgi:CRISPR-associated protein Csd2
MGSKHIVPYGLYRAHIFIDPVRARKPEINFTRDDQRVFEDALLNMFADRSDGKSELTIRAIFVFEHESDYGTPDLNGPELLDLIDVRRVTTEPAHHLPSPEEEHGPGSDGGRDLRRRPSGLNVIYSARIRCEPAICRRFAQSLAL